MTTMENEEIESILNCPICMEEYVDPRILPCQHSFCEACLSTYIKNLSKKNPLKFDLFPCPICRNKTKLKNNTDDASLFEKDLTKMTLLQSKHILLEQNEDSSDENEAYVTQAMTTQTEDIDKDSNKATILNGISVCDNRKLSLKKFSKRAVKKNAKTKGKRINLRKNVQNEKKKNENVKTEPEVNGYHDLEFIDYLLIHFIIVPIISWRPTGFAIRLILAIILLTVLIFFNVLVLTQVEYFYSIAAALWLFLFYRESNEILVSHCKVNDVRKYQKLLICFCVFQFIHAL